MKYILILITVVAILERASVSNGSKSAVRCLVRVAIELELLRWVVLHQKMEPHWTLTVLASSTVSRNVAPLEVQVYLWDYTGSLNNPDMDTWSGITNCHSDFRVGSTFQISSTISYISIIWPLSQYVNNSDPAKCKQDVYQLKLSNGCRISIVNCHFLSAGNLIPGRRIKNYSLMLQWFIADEMRCLQYLNHHAISRYAEPYE